MAIRPLFLPSPLESTSLVDQIDIEFEWSPGFAISQKQKSIRALHDGARQQEVYPVLEVSTKSPDPSGVKLSAFNLTVDVGNRSISLEAAFQGSKVFEGGGPYSDIYELNGPPIKRDNRLQTSGALVAFDWWGERWPLEPKTAFYDWLYLNALSSLDIANELSQFVGFTDIEFNPAKSINCQARSCALYVSLHMRGLLTDALDSSPEEFRRLLALNRPGQGSQHSLF